MRIWPQLNSFVKKNEAKILYRTHCNGLRLVDNYRDATLLQQSFLSLMAADDIRFDLKVENYLRALCEAMGIKFK